MSSLVANTNLYSQGNRAKSIAMFTNPMQFSSAVSRGHTTSLCQINKWFWIPKMFLWTCSFTHSAHRCTSHKYNLYHPTRNVRPYMIRWYHEYDINHCRQYPGTTNIHNEIINQYPNIKLSQSQHMQFPASIRPDCTRSKYPITHNIFSVTNPKAIQHSRQHWNPSNRLSASQHQQDPRLSVSTSSPCQKWQTNSLIALLV